MRSGMGELHLEIIIDRLKREFSVDANVGKPQVAYRETLNGTVEQEHKYSKQTGGRGQYVFELAKAGISQIIAGLFLETHPDPTQAKCDGPCALKLSDLDTFMEKIISFDEFVKSNR